MYKHYIARISSVKLPLVIAAAIILLLQACAIGGLSDKHQAGQPKDSKLGRAGFLENHGSVEFVRMDNIKGTIAFYDTVENEKILELGPKETKTVWFKGGDYTFLISDNIKEPDLGNSYEVSLTVVNTYSYKVRIVMDRDLAAKSGGSGIISAIGLKKGINILLALVLFSVVTGGAGTVTIPPIDFSDEAPAKVDSVEVLKI